MAFSSTHVQCRPKAHRAQRVAAHVIQPPDQNSAKKRDFAKGLTPDVLQMFHDAQSNILELNKSRLQALEELRHARDRIKELEETLRAYQEGAQLGGVPSAQPQNGAFAGSSATSTSQGASVGYDSWTQQGNGAGLGPNPRAPRQDLIRLVYASGWKKAFIHFKKDNDGWTKVPGQPMQRGTGEYEGMYVAEVPANSIEFVLTNGDNDWDTPDPSSGNKNYNIRSHGTYKLKSGRVHKLH